MIGVVLTEGAKIQPMGWVLIIGFLVVLVVGVIIGSIIDKKNKAAFVEEEAKRFEGKKVYGNDTVFITSDNELVIRYTTTGVNGYKIFKSEGVKYILSFWNPVDKIWCVGLYNEKKKNIAGEDHKSSKKKPLKTKAYFRTKSENVEFVELLVKFIPDAELAGMSFKEYKGGYKKQ